MATRDIRDSVRDGYDQVVKDSKDSSCCGPACCVGGDREKRARDLGYSDIDLADIPDEANLGLGCGNPTAIAALSPGEVVLDLGSGAGMDAFLAAAQVGDKGQVIGIDMTPSMLSRARNLATQKGVSEYVEFRRGYIEDLPVTSESIDVILSNCVINLSPDKPAVFGEAYRVLKRGGRLAISDICLTAPLPETLQQADAAYVGCISGALLAEEYQAAIKDAGFVDVSWTRTSAADLFDATLSDPTLKSAREAMTDREIEDARNHLWSYKFSAVKS